MLFETGKNNNSNPRDSDTYDFASWQGLAGQFCAGSPSQLESAIQFQQNRYQVSWAPELDYGTQTLAFQFYQEKANRQHYYYYHHHLDYAMLTVYRMFNCEASFVSWHTTCWESHTSRPLGMESSCHGSRFPASESRNVIPKKNDKSSCLSTKVSADHHTCHLAGHFCIYFIRALVIHSSSNL